jgi:hypothetical protein
MRIRFNATPLTVVESRTERSASSDRRGRCCIKAVVEKMKATKRKSRVTFYRLLAEATGTLGKLG